MKYNRKVFFVSAFRILNKKNRNLQTFRFFVNLDFLSRWCADFYLKLNWLHKLCSEFFSSNLDSSGLMMLKIEFSVLSPSPISSFSRDWQKSHVTDQSQTGKKNQLKSSSFFATLQSKGLSVKCKKKIHFGNFYSNSNAQIFDLLLKHRNRHIRIFPFSTFFFAIARIQFKEAASNRGTL